MSKSTRGGGKDNEPVIIEAKKLFGTGLFTFAEAKVLVSGYTRKIQTHLLNSTDLKTVPTPSGYAHMSLISGVVTIYGTSPKLYQFIY
jgi:hypothetical protein